MAALKTLASFVSRRSAAIVAASLFALWKLKAETEDEYLRDLPASSTFTSAVRAEMDIPRTLVAFNGAVIEQYPNYRTTCQQFIDDLVVSEGATPGTIDLLAAKESSVLGAAVALTCLEEGGAN